jgi:hypothetical protein
LALRCQTFQFWHRTLCSFRISIIIFCKNLEILARRPWDYLGVAGTRIVGGGRDLGTVGGGTEDRDGGKGGGVVAAIVPVVLFLSGRISVMDVKSVQL